MSSGEGIAPRARIVRTRDIDGAAPRHVHARRPRVTPAAAARGAAPTNLDRLAGERSRDGAAVRFAPRLVVVAAARNLCLAPRARGAAVDQHRAAAADAHSGRAGALRRHAAPIARRVRLAQQPRDDAVAALGERGQREHARAEAKARSDVVALLGIVEAEVAPE